MRIQEFAGCMTLHSGLGELPPLSLSSVKQQSLNADWQSPRKAATLDISAWGRGISSPCRLATSSNSALPLINPRYNAILRTALLVTRGAKPVTNLGEVLQA